jgi:hypothetical protein
VKGLPEENVVCSVGGRGESYRPRQPEQTVLYQVVAEHLETFLARQRQEDRHVPRFVEREFRKFMECGIPSYGFLRLRCDRCRQEKIVSFSCKGRAFCPSCCGRRMADTAAHLVDRVIPHVPVRQWVLSLPYALRYRLAYDVGMITEVLGVFVRAVFGDLRRRAREYGIEKAQCGAVTFVQRFGSALNCNVHLHMAVLDGVYAPKDNAAPEFFPLRAPETSDVLKVAEAAAHGVSALMKRRGLEEGTGDAEDSDKLVREDPWLAGVLAASVTGRIATGPQAGQRVATGGDRVDPEEMESLSSERCARSSGFSVHANVAVPARDRARLERLIRYMARPPLATERLERLPDGRLVYEFKRAWRDGTSRVVFEPLEFIEKLVALVPKPRANLTRYSGVIAPAAKWRPAVIPAPAAGPEVKPAASTSISEAPLANVTEATAVPESTVRHPRNYAWAELMRRVWEFDVLACACGGRLRILSSIHPPETTRKILDCMGLPSRPPPIAPARPEPSLDPAWI